MLNYLIPVVMFCIPMQDDHTGQFTASTNDKVCSGQTKIFEEVLDPVATPTQCLIDGNVRAATYIQEFQREHPHKELDFRIVCKRSDQKT